MTRAKEGKKSPAPSKTVTLRFRTDEEEAKKIREYCESHDITISDAIRKGLTILMKRK